MADQGPHGPDPGAGLQEDAQAAIQALSRLSTGLAHAGAPPEVTKGIGQMLDALHQLSSSMGKVRSASPAPAQQGPDTMDSAANSLVADVRAKKAA